MDTYLSVAGAFGQNRPPVSRCFRIVTSFFSNDSEVVSRQMTVVLQRWVVSLSESGQDAVAKNKDLRQMILPGLPVTFNPAL